MSNAEEIAQIKVLMAEQAKIIAEKQTLEICKWLISDEFKILCGPEMMSFSILVSQAIGKKFFQFSEAKAKKSETTLVPNGESNSTIIK